MPVKEAQPAPAEVPFDVRQKAEQPIPGSVPDVNARLDKAERTLASWSLAEIEKLPPDEALKILELRERLDRAKKLSAEREVEASAKIQMLKEVEREIEQRELHQAGCERTGHIRENGTTAISGQTGSNGAVYITVCQKCHKIFSGIGDQPGQLPSHIANRVDWEATGKG